MDNFIVVIGRQFGCGGRKIGRDIADALGADYYDKELLSEAAQEYGFSKKIFALKDERRPSFVRSLLAFNYGANSDFSDNTLSDEAIYRAQSEVIRNIGKKGNCVIVGRTADYVLRDHPKIISLFIHAPAEKRAREIVRRGDADGFEEALAMALKVDRDRESYYNYYTNRNWGKADNYDLTFDSSRFSAAAIIAILRDMLSPRN